MKYVKKDGIEQSVFEVSTDGLKELLQSVMNACCYKAIGTYDLKYSGWSIKIDPKTNKITSGPKLPCGITEYIDIKNYRYYTYEEHDDSLEITGTKIVAPRLAYILQDILSGKNGSIEEFMAYADDPELIPIDERIEKQNRKVNSIDNLEPEEKMAALKELKELLDRKKKLEYVSSDSLRNFYNLAKEVIQLKLISRTTFYENVNLPYKEVFEPVAKVGPGLG